MRFILDCKPGDHKALFDFVDQSEKLGEVFHHTILDGDTSREFRWMNQVPLNDANPDVLVNFIECWEKTGDKVLRFSWVSDIEINQENLTQITRGGRARWTVESAPQAHGKGSLCHELKLRA